jgi:O-antigen/teichoic acid export membrane protein
MSAISAVALKPSTKSILSLRWNVAWTFLGNSTLSASQWGITIVLAKLGSPEMVGQYALVLAMTTPVAMLGNLCLRSVLATDTQGAKFEDYLGLRLLATALAIVVVAAIALTGSHAADVAILICIVGVVQAADMISDIYYGLLQQHERMHRIALSMMIKGVLSLTLVGVCIYFTSRLLLAAIAIALARLAVLVAFDAQHCVYTVGQSVSYSTFLRSLRRQGRLALVALPLGIVMMLISLTTNVPRYFIAHYQGEHDLGMFAAIASLVTVGTTITTALGQAATPRLAKLFAARRHRDFYTLVTHMLGISCAMGVAGIAIAALAGKQVLRLLYRPEYAAHSHLLVAMMIAGSILYLAMMLGYAITAARCFKPQLPLHATVVTACALGSLLLIPRFGIMGAAYAITCAATVHLIGEVFILWRVTIAQPVEVQEAA